MLAEVAARLGRSDTVGFDFVTSGEPSPKSKWYEAMVSAGAALSGSDEPAPLKSTFNGAFPVVGFASSTAVGAVFARHEGLQRSKAPALVAGNPEGFM